MPGRAHAGDALTTASARSGTFVQIASTPQATSSRMRSGRPPSRAAPPARRRGHRATSRRVTRGCHGWMPVPACHQLDGQPGRLGTKLVEVGRLDARRPLVQAIDGRQVERRHDDPGLVAPRRHQVGDDTARLFDGSKPGSLGAFLISTLTPMPRARVERVVEERHAAAGRGDRHVDRRPSGSRGSWTTARAPSAVRRTSSSTRSAPSSTARRKAASVFSGRPGATLPDGR